MLLKAFDYSKGESRLFSKYFAKKNPDQYDVTIVDAIGAATSYPSYFKPKTIKHQNGETSTYIDLDIFAQTVSVDAFMLADQFILRDKFPDQSQKPKIRMMTINPKVRIDTPVEKVKIGKKQMASTWETMIYFN